MSNCSTDRNSDLMQRTLLRTSSLT